MIWGDGMRSASTGTTSLAGLPIMKGLAVAAAFIGTFAAAQAQTQDVPAPAGPFTLNEAAAVFGLRPSILQASLSPDGKLMAVVQPNGARGEQVRVLDLSDPNSSPQAIVAVEGNPDRID